MMRCATIGICLAVLFPVLLPAAASGQGCGLEATPIPGLGLGPGVTGTIDDMTMFDDGSGEALIVGGSFTVLDAGGRSIKGVARWDGSAWSSIGETGNVRSIVAFDDGSGPALIAAGYFSTALPHEERTIRRWKDGAWGPIGDGLRTGGYGYVHGVEVVEHAGAEALVAVGSDLRADGETVSAALWNGSAWEPLGDAPTDFYHIEGFQGSLYAVESVSSQPDPVYRLEGEQWLAVAEIPEGAYALQTFEDQGVEYLYLGGAGGARLGRFDGVSFEEVESGLDRAAIGLAASDESGTHVLYAMSRSMIRRYDGAGWTTVGIIDDGYTNEYCLLPADAGGAATLYVGGDFNSIDGVAALAIASHRAGQWQAMGQAAPPVITAIAESPAPGDDAIYIGGTGLYDAAGAPLGHAAVLWDGAAEPLGEALDSPPSVLMFHDDGAGTLLYAGGSFDFHGELSAVARWDGDEWRHVGNGLAASGSSGQVDSLFEFDDGSEPALYAGGDFTESGATKLANVARWRGGEWERVGDGLDIHVLDFDAVDVNGERSLLAGGTDWRTFNPPCLWYWDGAQWILFPGELTGRVSEFTMLERSGGPELMVAGWVRMPGLTGGWLLGGYDGAAWNPTGIELIEYGGTVSSRRKSIGMFESFPSPSGEALIVSATIFLWLEPFGGGRIEDVAVLDGAAWCDPGADDVIRTSVRSADGSFLIGGELTRFGGVNFIGPARLHVSSCYADCDGSGELDFFDFLCFQNRFAAGEPEADCNGSGELDFFDFLCFQNAFAAACP